MLLSRRRQEATLRSDQIDAWIFDLDNTLYPASSSLFPQIDVRMREFISKTLRIDLDEAFRLQKGYYRQFGTTLRGLMLMHQVEPRAYLDYVHEIDHSVLDPAPALGAALRRLPGRKLIFTNGTVHHAERVLERLGLSDCFDGIFDIVAADYVPKPEASSYAAMARRHGVDLKRAAMFEDLIRNLAPAAQLGMTTVLVADPKVSEPEESGRPRDFPFIHHVTDDLAKWLAGIS